MKVISFTSRMFRRPLVNQILRLRSTVARSADSVISEDSDLAPQDDLKQSQIDEAVKLVPSLSHVQHDTWKNYHKIFLNYGFKSKNFIEIISQHPKLLNRPPTKIHESLELWRNCQFGTSRVEELILRYPHFLDIFNDKKVHSQINALKSLVNTSKNVWLLVMNSPNVIGDNMIEINEKFLYMRDVMRLEVSEIVKSEAFSFTFEELKTRHVFLERLGIFKARSLKAPPGEISKNPRLHLIMDPSESKFASRVALVTLAEFEAFKELYRRELEGDVERSDEESFS